MTIMTEQDMADYMKVRSAREVWIEACHSGADAMAGHDKPGPAIAARDEAASAVIEAAILAMAEENKRLREALEQCAECDPESAMFAARALRSGEREGA